jgi:hypothetical protein
MIHIVLNAVKMLNFFPTKGGISNTLSPKTISWDVISMLDTVIAHVNALGIDEPEQLIFTD